jgi:hypothetical protein
MNTVNLKPNDTDNWGSVNLQLNLLLFTVELWALDKFKKKL